MTVAVGRTVLVGLGERYCSREAGHLLVARPLGSTAALALLDPVIGVGGLAHWMLPESSVDPDRSGRNPGMFADTGIMALISELEAQGAALEGLTGALAGAASLPEGGPFDVGKRNREAARSLLREIGIHLVHEQTGGVEVRELTLEIGPGAFQIRYLNR
jgi:chemotaxis protein CheD